MKKLVLKNRCQKRIVWMGLESIFMTRRTILHRSKMGKNSVSGIFSHLLSDGTPIVGLTCNSALQGWRFRAKALSYTVANTPRLVTEGLRQPVHCGNFPRAFLWWTFNKESYRLFPTSNGGILMGSWKGVIIKSLKCSINLHILLIKSSFRSSHSQSFQF